MSGYLENFQIVSNLRNVLQLKKKLPSDIRNSGYSPDSKVFGKFTRFPGILGIPQIPRY